MHAPGAQTHPLAQSIWHACLARRLAYITKAFLSVVNGTSCSVSRQQQNDSYNGMTDVMCMLPAMAWLMGCA